jgi:hypothetical protein
MPAAFDAWGAAAFPQGDDGVGANREATSTVSGPFTAERARKAAEADDDDVVSRTLSWPQSLHCSGAGLTAVPQPLPSSLEYM